MQKLSDYTYDLPEELIAQELAHPADSCRLLHYMRGFSQISHHTFTNLSSLIPAGANMFFNTSKVVKARILLPDNTGEIFFLHAHDSHEFDALVRPGKKMKIGTCVQYGIFEFNIIGMTSQGRRIRCSHPILDVLENIGHMPLPPYISYEEKKSAAYQPLLAHDEHKGSIAAPTASLHFTHDTFVSLKEKNIQIHKAILHVGLGTFKSVDVEDIQEYDIHSERIQVDINIFEKIYTAKKNGDPIVAVGTTITRTLETLPYVRVLQKDREQNQLSSECIAYRNHLTKDISNEKASTYAGNIQLHEDETLTIASTLFIYPPYTFLVIDQMVTNFHLPKSSLLMLVAAFVGHKNMRKIYDTAIEQGYKFYSFGDAMLLS